MMDAGVATRQGALLGRLGLALVAWLIGGGLTATPTAAQACVGTVASPAGTSAAHEALPPLKGSEPSIQTHGQNVFARKEPSLA